MGETLTYGLSLGALYGLLAIGIVLVYKATRVLNFAQAEIGTFAAYVAWYLIQRRGVPWLVGALIAVVVVAGIGFAVERFVIRRMLDGPKLTMVVATLGVMLLLGSIELVVWGGSPQAFRAPIQGRGPELFGLFVSPTRILALGVALAVAGALYLFIKKTTFGLGLLASAQDPVAVRLMGIRLRHLSSFTWVTGAVLGGIAGILIVPALGGTLAPFFVTSLFVPALAAALLGGVTSIPGAFVGGLAVGVLQGLLRQFLGGVPGIEEAGMFVLLLALLLFRPQGLFGKAA